MCEQYTFASYADLADHIMQHVFKNECVTLIAYHSETAQIFKELMDWHKCMPGAITFEMPEWGGYDAEYILTVDTDGLVYIEPMWHEANEYHKAGYIDFESDYTMINNSCDTTAVSKHPYDVFAI